jgi:HAD superfamily hydrolase (TIGR01509 family)
MSKALLLDFDGLVLDTETTDFESWAEVYREHRVELPRDRWERAIGSDGSGFAPFEHLCELTGLALDETEVRARRRPRRDAMVAGLRPLPGVEDWIRAARERGMGVAIVSSSPTWWVEQHLEGVGMHAHFDFLMTVDRADNAKPHPELYLRALAEFQLSAADALAVEDSPNGVQAAKAAQLFCVAVPGPMTRRRSFEHADLLLDSLESRSLETVLTARSSDPVRPLG